MRAHREDDEILSETELSEMLSVWNMPDAPTEQMRARIFLRGAMRETAERPYRVEAPSVWNGYRWMRGRSAALSVLIHAAAFGMLLVGVQSPMGQRQLKRVSELYFVPLKSYRPKVEATDPAGGRGGMKDKPAIRGEAPQSARKPFLAPAMVIPEPKLAVMPTIDADAPQIVSDNYGDPLSKLDQGGLGAGAGTGVGNGTGGGYDAGSGIGTGRGVYKPGGGVSLPKLISKTEPEYSEDARRAKYSGSVLLTIVVDQNGVPRDIRVVRALGLGLDEKAIEAVRRWRFQPGLKGGRPVAVEAQVEVSFRLL